MKFLGSLINNLDLKYLVATICVILSVYSGLTGEYFMRSILNAGVDPLIAILIRFISIKFIFIIMLIISRREIINRDSLKIDFLRSLLIITANYLWSTGVIISGMRLPIYMTSLISLSVPIFVTVFSKIFLKEKITPNRSCLVLISAIFLFGLILKYFLLGIYSKSILLILVSCIFYSLLDISNMFIVSDKNKEKNLGAQMFQTILFCFLITSVFLLVKTLTGSIDLEKQKWIMKELIKTSFFSITFVGFFSILASGLILLSFRLKKTSSAQYIKILEPLMAGSIDRKIRIPNDVLLVIMILFLTSISNFFLEIRAKKDKL